MVAPDEVEDLVVRELANSALFGARFRENAARALLLPRRQPNRRTPLWMQRRKSADLLAVASRYERFPIDPPTSFPSPLASVTCRIHRQHCESSAASSVPAGG